MSTTTTTHSQITNTTLDFRVKYKTEKCRYWYERGFCPFGQWCAFAHSPVELRDKAQLTQHYKTKVCLNFKTHGYCKYGQRCHFLHQRQGQPEETKSLHSEPVARRSESGLEGRRHRKEMEAIKEFGLEVFWRLKRKRSAAWEDLLSGDTRSSGGGLTDWEEAFPDYDFKRKPRLGSM